MKILFCALSGLLIQFAVADSLDNLETSGNLTIHDQHYKRIDVSGNFYGDRIIADKKMSVSGSTSCDHCTLNDVMISGSTDIESSKILGDLDVSGQLMINQSSVAGSIKCSGKIVSYKNNFQSSLDISGNMNSDHDIFESDLTISGDIKASNSQFKKNIILSSRESTLKDTVVVGNIINDNNAFLGTPTIILNNSKVMGKIVFKSKKGTVVLKKGSTINNIENAEIIRK
jgi:hypothetical protein